MAESKLRNFRNAVKPSRWASAECETELEKQGITPAYIYAGIKEIADNAPKERDRLRAFALLAKLASLMPPERILVSPDDELELAILPPEEENESE